MAQPEAELLTSIPRLLWLDYEREAEGLFEAARAGCYAAEADFSDRVRMAIDTVLVRLACNPEIARLLVLEPYGDNLALQKSHRAWLDRYANLLREAAQASSPLLSHPPFLEGALLRGVRRQISVPIASGQPERLRGLGPELARYILSYYLPPEEARKAAARRLLILRHSAPLVTHPYRENLKLQ